MTPVPDRNIMANHLSRGGTGDSWCDQNVSGKEVRRTTSVNTKCGARTNRGRKQNALAHGSRSPLKTQTRSRLGDRQVFHTQRILPSREPNEANPHKSDDSRQNDPSERQVRSVILGDAKIA